MPGIILMKKQSIGLALAALTSTFAATASAQTISIDPGEWRYIIDGKLGPTPLSNSGTDCVSPDEATADLGDLVNALSNDCNLISSDQSGDSISAKVVCTGSLPIEADLALTVAGDSAEAVATGALFTGTPAEAPISFMATAIRTGQCSG